MKWEGGYNNLEHIHTKNSHKSKRVGFLFEESHAVCELLNLKQGSRKHHDVSPTTDGPTRRNVWHRINNHSP